MNGSVHSAAFPARFLLPAGALKSSSASGRPAGFATCPGITLLSPSTSVNPRQTFPSLCATRRAAPARARSAPLRVSRRQSPPMDRRCCSPRVASTSSRRRLIRLINETMPEPRIASRGSSNAPKANNVVIVPVDRAIRRDASPRHALSEKV